MRTPERKKRPRAVDETRWGSSDAIGVVLLPLVRLDQDARAFVVSVNASGGRESSHLLHCGRHFSKVLEFDCAPDVGFRGPEPVTANMKQALTALMFTGAYNEAGYLSLPEHEGNAAVCEGLHDLRDLGITDVVDVGDIPHWFVTQDGAEPIQLSITLSKPRDACALRDGVVHERRSTWELMSALRSDGWQCEVWDASTRRNPKRQQRESTDHPPFLVSANGPKIWYVKPDAREVYIGYLRCLSNIATLQAMNVEEVAHFMPKEYYLALLGKRTRRQRGNLAICDDAGAALDAPIAIARPLPLPIPNEGDAVAPGADGSSARARRTGVKRVVREETHYYGPCLVTFKPPRSWQITCHRTCSHRNTSGRKSTCRSTTSFGGAISSEDALNSLYLWANKAHECTTRIEHQNYKGAQRLADARALGTDGTLEGKPSSDYGSDDGGAAGDRGRGRGRGRARAKGVGKARPKRGPGRPRKGLLALARAGLLGGPSASNAAAPDDEHRSPSPETDSDSSEGSTSSQSDSTSSSPDSDSS